MHGGRCQHGDPLKVQPPLEALLHFSILRNFYDEMYDLNNHKKQLPAEFQAHWCPSNEDTQGHRSPAKVIPWRRSGADKIGIKEEVTRLTALPAVADNPSASLGWDVWAKPRYLEGQVILPQKRFLTKAEFADVTGHWVQTHRVSKEYMCFDYWDLLGNSTT